MPRRITTKSRTGCTTCKIRKVKCDETHPSCRRCTSTGRKCDGFATDSFINVNKPAGLAARTKIFVNKTQSQVQAFDFFVSRLLPGMSRVVKGDYWNHHLLQAAHSEPAVWLAINSMSELIQQVAAETPILKSTARKALTWYGQSLQETQTLIRRDSGWSSICSITAIIYICIECLLDNLGGAFNFYAQAMQALIAMGEKGMKDPVHRSVVALFHHITAAHGLSLPSSSQINVLSDHFTNLQEARSVLEQLIGSAQMVVSQIEQARKIHSRDWQLSPNLLVERDRELKLLLQWDSAVKRLEEEHPVMQDDDRLNLSSMYLGQLTYFIWLSALPEASKETTFDLYFPQFEDMLNHAEIVIEACGGRQTLFSFETRVLSMLTFVATRCRHPVLRRKAVELLRCGPRIENSKKAIHAVKMAQAFIAFEESGSIDVPFHEQPLSLVVPSEQNRIAWADTRHLVNEDGSASTFITFGKWQTNAEGHWYLTQEIIEI